ncbi:MAG: hypothetical protein ABJG68_09500 [Crocinitomicaceae bacterium]
MNIRTTLIYLFLITFAVGIHSCQASFGNRYERGNLEIFYPNTMVNFVEPLADYFEENDLIFDAPQSIQLGSSELQDEEPTLFLKMVQNDAHQEFTEDELKNVQLLEEDLQEKIFGNANFKIILCNGNFIPIE